jgi:hypothetical protein
MDDASNEMGEHFMHRGYLLPHGCKDLIDVWQPKRSMRHIQIEPSPPDLELFTSGKIPLAPMSVCELAAAWQQKPFRTLRDLMEHDVFARPDQILNAGTLLRLLQKYGYTAGESCG